MGFCKESEKGICRPFKCKVPCDTGKILRDTAVDFPRCEKPCSWIIEGINNGLSSSRCKDASCPTGNIIVEFRKKIR